MKIWFLGNLQQQLTRRGMCLEVFADRREHRADRLQDQLEGAPLLGREPVGQHRKLPAKRGSEKLRIGETRYEDRGRDQ